MNYSAYMKDRPLFKINSVDYHELMSMTVDVRVIRYPDCPSKDFRNRK